MNPLNASITVALDACSEVSRFGVPLRRLGDMSDLPNKVLKARQTGSRIFVGSELSVSAVRVPSHHQGVPGLSRDDLSGRRFPRSCGAQPNEQRGSACQRLNRRGFPEGLRTMKWPPGPRRNGHIAVGNTRGSRAKADRTRRQQEDRRPVGHHPRVKRCAQPRPPLGTSAARRFPGARPCPPASIPTGRRSDARPLRRGPRRSIVPTLADIRAYGEARAAHLRCRAQSRLNVSRGQRLVKAPDHPKPAGAPDHRIGGTNDGSLVSPSLDRLYKTH